MDDFTFDDILRELETLQRDVPEGFTTAEMSKTTGLSTVVCRKKMKLLIECGRLECVGRKNIIALDGVARPVPVYRVVDNES